MAENIGIMIPVVMLAALVRGFSGFGFAAIAVIGMNLIFSPQQSVPVILSLDLLCSINLWRQARQQANYTILKKLIIGSFLGIPLGLALLILLPAETLKLAICLFILLFSLFLACNIRLPYMNKALAPGLFGFLSGAGTASASVGGPMVVCYMLSSPLNPQQQRATMILFFIVSELLAVTGLLATGVFSWQSLSHIAILLIPTMVAVRLGQALFNRWPPRSFKHIALPVMVCVSLVGIQAAVRAIS
ncbi:sulfite exporter TauE/SafE family protein [Agarivorans sp. 1_MG-2023]|uniref:sulfite exporter TauE/SafE family protein n=1 Tax=Agarivorans sp. 1_MG-2023 TaxID=3062634 RepID=UPI0026E27D84|nr:sulfite exporter TauE/SafE family protein [Agarivorans sp. 1_MG-2023]MDO6763397.1 sulfite exporter TauE/SafE family protein [Agarivorans sp. 1_MG-2023]